MKTIPIPSRMSHLPLDRRGYPIPSIVYRDDEGHPHFQINEEAARQHVIANDCCSICGQKLLRGRWFVGGPLSAFSKNGQYIDPPMHRECVEYALQVCPYLAAPHYGKEIGFKTLKGRPAEQHVMALDPTSIPGRPSLFVAVMAVGQDKTIATVDDFPYPPGVVRYVRPKLGTIRAITCWWQGAQIAASEVIPEIRAALAEWGEAGRVDAWGAIEGVSL